MLAVILAGGRGTRLQPFTMSIPKPLLPLGDIPILEIVIRQLVSAGVQRIILTLGHMAPLFPAVLGEPNRFGVPIDYYYEQEPLGTAGSLRLLEGIDEADLLVMNGDLLTTLDYGSLIHHHRERGAWGTIAVKSRQVHVDFGVVVLGPDDSLAEYREKPTLTYDVSMGINVLSRRSLELIPSTGRFDMPDLMMAIRQSGRLVSCYRTDCYWQDIGRFDDYQRASEDFVKEPAKFLPDPASRPLN